MAQKKRRAKSDPTIGDKLHQAYRNRAAMARVYDSAVLARFEVEPEKIRRHYWNPSKLIDGLPMTNVRGR